MKTGKKIQVLEKPNWVSWDDIHEVLIKAHASNRANGINMRKPSLPGEEIAKEIGNDGKMFVALDDKQVVGAGAIIPKCISSWYHSGIYGYMCFGSVMPEYSGNGIYCSLLAAREKYVSNNGIFVLRFDTHIKNTHIIDINRRNGFKKVDIKVCNDHINIVMVKWLNGCPYTDLRCWYEFHKRQIIVKIKKRVVSIMKNNR